MEDGRSSNYEPTRRSEIQEEFDGVDDWEENRIVKNAKKILPFIAVIVAVVALVLAIIAVVNQQDASEASSDALSSVASYFPGLVDDEDGLAVRLASEDCKEDGYCEDLNSIYCTEKGAVRVFKQPNGHELLCVCNGQYWKCDAIGKFCVLPPTLPSGGSFAFGEDCSNSAHSETCSFGCLDEFEPSGVFTCTDGQWDKQYCACTGESLENSLEHPVISDVEVCDMTADDERCVGWSCAGTLLPARNAEIECTSNGWDISEPLCVCQAATLHTALGIKGIDFVDVKNCDNTPAGELCSHYDWNCPKDLFQVGEMECRYDGSWEVPDYPCVCGEDAPEIFGFDSACEYLHVGKSCDYDDWECEDDLIPITDLECTTEGLMGECGCSEEALESALPPGSNADVSKCHKTPIHEQCLDYTCLNGFNKHCCNAPICKEEGQWQIPGDLCKDGCDPADLAKYNPSCGVENIAPDEPCPITCNVVADDPFVCPNEMSTCNAICLEDGTWDVPCVCNPDILRKVIPFAVDDSSSPPIQCGFDHEDCTSDVMCDSVFLNPYHIKCDPWKGWTGACICDPLVNETDWMSTFEPWSCEHYPSDTKCEDFCPEDMEPADVIVVCTGLSGWLPKPIAPTDVLPHEPVPLCRCICDPSLCTGDPGEVLCVNPNNCTDQILSPTSTCATGYEFVGLCSSDGSSCDESVACPSIPGQFTSDMLTMLNIDSTRGVSPCNSTATKPGDSCTVNCLLSCEPGATETVMADVECLPDGTYDFTSSSVCFCEVSDIWPTFGNLELPSICLSDPDHCFVVAYDSKVFANPPCSGDDISCAYVCDFLGFNYCYGTVDADGTCHSLKYGYFDGDCKDTNQNGGCICAKEPRCPDCESDDPCAGQPIGTSVCGSFNSGLECDLGTSIYANCDDPNFFSDHELVATCIGEECSNTTFYCNDPSPCPGEIQGSCTPLSDSFSFAGGFVDCGINDFQTKECGFECINVDGQYTGGLLECDVNTGILGCVTGEHCECCTCNSTICDGQPLGMTVCANATTCLQQNATVAGFCGGGDIIQIGECAGDGFCRCRCAADLCVGSSTDMYNVCADDECKNQVSIPGDCANLTTPLRTIGNCTDGGCTCNIG